MINFIYYTLVGLNEWLTLVFSLDFKNIRIVRAVLGGTWHKQTMPCELPRCYGSWWTRQPLKPCRFHFTEKVEHY